MDRDDTIAAISTPPGVGGIAVVRMSGPLSASILSRVTGGQGEFEPRRVYHRWVVDAAGERIDEALVFLLKKPHSYTGEDMAEIQGHGGTAVAQRVLARVIECGARLAGPGEFSQRAFLNGRMDLAQAEDVMSLIGARTEAAARISARHMEGKWSRQVGEMYDSILDLLVQVEAAVDFADEGLLPLDRDTVRSQIVGMRSQILAWLENADAGLLLMEGMRTVILGRPNVGKSSLLNRLCREERAIVTETPGTTRDVVEAEIVYQGLLIRLLDTAGLREAGDEAERIGIARAISWIEKADRILYVLDGTAPLDAQEREQLASLTASRSFAVINKSDLPGRLHKEELSAIFPGPIFLVSAKTGEGIDRLLQSLYESALGPGGSAEHEIAVIRVRHLSALRHADEALSGALCALEREHQEELAATDLREAAEYLGQITGQSVTEDMAERIFAQFCVGK